MLFKDEFIAPSAFSNHIRRQKGHGIHNLRVKRTCLSLIENKRWWLTKYESLAYGHPDIPKNQYKPDDILSDVGCTIKGSIPISRSLFSNNVAVDNPANTNPPMDIESPNNDNYILNSNDY